MKPSTDAESVRWFLIHRNGGPTCEVISCAGWPKMLLDGGDISSRSGPYSTREELVEKQGLQPACSACGSAYNTTYMEPIRSRMLRDNHCFNCDFWTDMVQNKLGPATAVIDGCWYTIEREPKPGQSREWCGMAGREFKISFLDGRQVTTHNLWYSGEIPARFRNLAPDNARFDGGAGRVEHPGGFCFQESTGGAA